MMSKKYEGHKKPYVVRQMSAEEAQMNMKKREEKAIEMMQKYMQKMEKQLNKVEKLLENDTLADKGSDVIKDESDEIKAEIPVQGEETGENISGKFAKYEKILAESSQKGDQLCKIFNKKQKRKILKKIKKIRSLSKKMTKKYNRFIMYGEESNVYKEEKKQTDCTGFVKKVGDTFLKALPSLLCTAVKALISRFSPRRKAFV